MPTFPTPPPVAAALVAACEPLFAMMESDPRYVAEGERMVVALLEATRTLDLTALLLIRRLRGRLEHIKRNAAATATAPSLSLRAPRHG